MNTFVSLIIARNKEFYRDRGSMIWAFVFPVLIIIGCALAFSDQDKNLFTVGSYQLSETQQAAIPLLQAPYVKHIVYQDLDKALDRVAHHQLHLLVGLQHNDQQQGLRYWINDASSEGRVLEQLIQQQAPELQKQPISGKAVRYVDWVIPGVLGMNIMFGSLFGVGYVIVRYRKMGVLKRLQATPISALQFLAAQVISRLFILVGATVIIFTGSNLVLDFLVLGSYFDLLLVAIAGALAMISLGLIMSARTESEELAGGILNATTWPMMFLSGVWFSLDDAPEYMQWLANCLPLTHLVKAGREIMINGASLMDVSLHLVVLLAMAFCFLTIASLSFRWHR